MEKNFDDIRNHIIVCGFGRVGKQASADFLNSFERFVIIERDKGVIEEITQNQQLYYVEGDATHDEVLELANIMEAKGLLATFPNDADNLFVIVSARALNPNISIISRIAQEINTEKILDAGANEVIMPDKVGGGHMAQLVTRPDLIEFLDALLLQSADEVNLEEIRCHALPKNRKHSIQQLQIRKNTGVNVVGVKLGNGHMIHNPDPDMFITCNDTLLVLGTPTQVQKMREFLTDWYEKDSSDR